MEEKKITPDTVTLSWEKYEELNEKIDKQNKLSEDLLISFGLLKQFQEAASKFLKSKDLAKDFEDFLNSPRFKFYGNASKAIIKEEKVGFEDVYNIYLEK